MDAASNTYNIESTEHDLRMLSHSKFVQTVRATIMQIFTFKPACILRLKPVYSIFIDTF